MNDRIDATTAKHDVECVAVADVGFDEIGSSTGNGFDAVEHRGAAVREIIDDNRCPAGGHQFDAGMRADEAGTAGKQDAAHE